MALIIDLKPFEKILIGSAVITNDDQRTRLHIAGDAPILREKDVLQEDGAHTPCRKIYFLIQCMYLAIDPKVYFDKYFQLIRDIQNAAPALTPYFLRINEMIIGGSYYKAMKEARKLIKHEDELLSHVEQQQAN
jgi:flagellar protein FlbT